jgi:hypothetical protein
MGLIFDNKHDKLSADNGPINIDSMNVSGAASFAVRPDVNGLPIALNSDVLAVSAIAVSAYNAVAGFDTAGIQTEIDTLISRTDALSAADLLLTPIVTVANISAAQVIRDAGQDTTIQGVTQSLSGYTSLAVAAALEGEITANTNNISNLQTFSSQVSNLTGSFATTTYVGTVSGNLALSIAGEAAARAAADSTTNSQVSTLITRTDALSAADVSINTQVSTLITRTDTISASNAADITNLATNYYDKTTSDSRFVHLTGDETIGGNKVLSGDISILGNVTIAGTTTTASAQNLQIGDNIISLNYNVTGAPIFDAGLEVIRGNQTRAQVLWDETNDTWVVGISGALTKVWTQGNDGAGSGLDADLLDGNDSSFFAAASTVAGVTGQLVKKSGDTITGALNISGALTVSNNISSFRSFTDEVAITVTNAFSGSSAYTDVAIISDTVNARLMSFSSTYNGFTRFGSSLANNVYFGSDAAGLVALKIGTGVSAPVIFGSNNVESMRIAPLSGNVLIATSSDDGSSKLQVSGKTLLNGAVNISGSLSIASSALINGNTAWHAGNDGSGSGLDADLLDGNDSTAFVNVANAQNVNGSKTFTGATIFTAAVSSSDDNNTNGPNFFVNTITKTVAEYAYAVGRSGVKVGGIKIDGSGVFSYATISNSSSTIGLDVSDTRVSPAGQILRVNSSATTHTTPIFDVISSATGATDILMRARSSSTDRFTVFADGHAMLTGAMNISGALNVANTVGGTAFKNSIDDISSVFFTGSNSLAGTFANIFIYGKSHASQANRIFYDAARHAWRSADGASDYLVADGSTVTSSLPLTVNAGNAENNITVGNLTNGWPTIKLLNAATHYSFLMGVNNLVNNALEFTPSITSGSSTFSSAAMLIFGDTRNVVIGNTTDNATDRLQVTGTVNISATGGTTSPMLTLRTPIDGNARTLRFIDMFGSKYNWQIGAQILTNNAFEIMAGAAPGSTTFLTSALSIANNGAMTNNISGGFNLTLNGTAAAGSCLRFTVQGGANTNWLVANNFNVGHALEFTPSTLAGGAAFITPAMIINNSSRILMGSNTDDGTNKLQVSGSVGITAAGTEQFHVWGSNSAYTYVGVHSTNNYGRIGSFNAASSTWRPLAVNEGGRTLVGTTIDDGASTLQVGGSTSISGNSTTALIYLVRTGSAAGRAVIGADSNGFCIMNQAISARTVTINDTTSTFNNNVLVNKATDDIVNKFQVGGNASISGSLIIGAFDTTKGGLEINTTNSYCSMEAKSMDASGTATGFRHLYVNTAGGSPIWFGGNSTNGFPATNSTLLNFMSANSTMIVAGAINCVRSGSSGATTGGTINLTTFGDNGTLASPALPTINQIVGQVVYTGYDTFSSNLSTAASITVRAASGWATASNPAYMTFGINSGSGSLATEVARITRTGALLINNNTDNGIAKLQVTGTITMNGGHGFGVTSTATAAGSTTIQSTGSMVQIFTGTQTQTVNLPPANVFGTGISAVYVIVNRSTQTVTLARAGSDTFNAGATTLAVPTVTTTRIASDGVSAWYSI